LSSGDRRTVAKALSSVPKDGHISGEKAWHLTTALRAILEPRPGGAQRFTEHNDIVARLEDRLEHPPILHSEIPTLSVGEYAGLTRQSASNVLKMLKAGMPFVEEGDWRTGEGFTLRLHWAMEWEVYLTGCVFNMGRQDILARFGLPTSRI
jgi:hypothetical protein